MLNLNSFKIMWAEAFKVSNITGRSRFFHMIDAFRQYVLFGIDISQYIRGHTYRMRDFELCSTVTANRWNRTRRKFNDVRFEHLLENKVDFNRHFSQFVKRKWISSKECTPVQIQTFIEKYGKVIVKPCNKMKGSGIHITDSYREEYSYGEYIIEEIVKQHPAMVLNNSSVNTIRLYTILTSSYQDVHVIKACLRGGVGTSVVDNFCAGGVCYPIDETTGIIYGPGYDKSFAKEYLIHPGSDIIMVGKKIPYWDKVIAMVKEAALTIPQVRLVGWYVAISSDGVQLIEGNHNPDLQMLEYVGRSGHLKQILALK